MKLVMIEWVDANSTAGRWNRLHEIAEDPKPVKCRSVGWLLRSTKQCKQLVPHLSGEEDGRVPYGSGDLTIPNKCIIKMTVLRK